MEFINFGEYKYLISILLSIVLGFIIGYERKHRVKEAGVRTHTIVCLGSALIMVVSKYGFEGLDADPSRIAAQIVSGIGFIGAGIIVLKNKEVRGLTTAAGIWTTSGVGMACGAGLYVTAVGATILLVVVQCLLHLKVFHNKRYYTLSICFMESEENAKKVKDFFNTDRFNKYYSERKEDGVYCNVTIMTDKWYHSEVINKFMEDNPFIVSIKREDE